MWRLLSFVITAPDRVRNILARDDKGATAVEYALIVSLIAVVLITVLTGLGAKLVSTFTSVTSSLP